MIRHLWLLGVMITGISPGLVHAQRPDAAASRVPAGKHCVASAEPAQSKATPSVVKQVGCFATVAEALAVATDGAVRVDPQTRQLTTEMLRKAGDRILAVAYANFNWNADEGTLTFTSGKGCGPGTSYGFERIPEFNDVTSSLRAGICGTNLLFENVNFNKGGKGEVATCRPSCKGLRIMNDKTSSVVLAH